MPGAKRRGQGSSERPVSDLTIVLFPYPGEAHSLVWGNLSCAMVYHTEETFTELTALANGNYENCAFVNCKLADADLGGSNFIDCHFQDCDLSNASLIETGLKSVTFAKCKLLGLHFEDCANFLFAITCTNCQLELATFQHWKLPGTAFHECLLLEVDFTGADLEGSTFRGCDLSRTIFHRTNLQKVDFSTAVNYRLAPEENRIRGARFRRAGVEGLLAHYGIHLEE